MICRDNFKIIYPMYILKGDGMVIKVNNLKMSLLTADNAAVHWRCQYR